MKLLSIFHLKHLGPRAIEYIITLFNLSVTTCQIPAIWKSSLIIPIPKPGKDTSVGTSYRPISLLCQAESTGVSDSAHYQQIYPTAPDQHGFRPDHSTTSALLQMTTDIAITIYCQISTDHSSPGHSAMAVMLSERKASQDLLQRCKIDV